MVGDKVSVIIPTLNAENDIEELISALLNQSHKPDEIIVIDSESDDNTVAICKRFDIKVMQIMRKDFDHGATRDAALRASRGDFVLFFTQDAIPANEKYIANILKPFTDKIVAMVTGRQVARRNASAIECLTREFNYPQDCSTRSKEDIPQLGIKTFFSSDCCSAYRRTAYTAVGGFDSPIIISEDLVIAARLIYAGYKTAYCGDACVLHSHRYTLLQQYKRNYDTAINISIHRDLFDAIPIQSEGIRMVKFVLSKLLHGGHLLQAGYYCLECGVKWWGFRRGQWHTQNKTYEYNYEISSRNSETS